MAEFNPVTIGAWHISVLPRAGGMYDIMANGLKVDSKRGEDLARERANEVAAKAQELQKELPVPPRVTPDVGYILGEALKAHTAIDWDNFHLIPEDKRAAIINMLRAAQPAAVHSAITYACWSQLTGRKEGAETFIHLDLPPEGNWYLPPGWALFKDRLERYCNTVRNNALSQGGINLRWTT